MTEPDRFREGAEALVEWLRETARKAPDTATDRTGPMLADLARVLEQYGVPEVCEQDTATREARP
jgi:hypothetical protein